MIAYRDFTPTPPAALFAKPAELREAFERALDAANEWADRESIEVINVETVGLGDTVPLQRMIRIWYRARP